MSVRIRITSKLPVDSRAALEELLFFNARQHQMRAAIEDSIARYGLPEIVESEGSLRVNVAGLPGVQCLYAMRQDGGQQRLIGVVIYVRDSVERLTVVHVGVADDAVVGERNAGQQVLLRLLQEIRRVAKCTSGIRHVKLAYRQSREARASLGPIAAVPC
jgi:hypothetical protein